MLDLGDCAAQVEGFGEHDFEDLGIESVILDFIDNIAGTHLLHIDTVAGTRENQRRLHRLRKPLGL